MNIGVKRSVVSTLLCLFAGGWISAASSQGAAVASPEIIQSGDRAFGKSDSVLQIARDAKALQKIVISPKANEEIRATAAYLSQKLAKITGATFEIVEGDGTGGLVLGTIAEFPVAALQKPLEVRPALNSVTMRNGVEAFGIRTEARRLLLLGGDTRGVSHAASRFLELLGYRRYYPGAEWEIVPSLPNLSFGRNETDRPSILARKIWFAFGGPTDPYIVNVESEDHRARKELSEWDRQNRLGETFKAQVNHTWQGIYDANKEEYEAHPELWGTYRGQRLKGLVCPSNPRVREMLVTHALQEFAKNPDLDMVSMERNDGDIICECEKCQALGDDSARLYGVANEVARAVRQKYPGKMVGVLAYNTHDLPPDFDIEPNVHVQIARLFIRSRKTFRQLVDMWSQKTPNIGIYDYFSTFQWGQDRLRAKAGAGPTADLALLRSDIPFLAKKGILSLWSESCVAWGAHGRGNLAATRLLWNPETDVDALLADFYEKAFGPAAPAMKRYFERVDGQNETFSKTLLALAFRDVDEAAKLAKDRSDVQARIDQIKQFLIYNDLMWRDFETKDAVTRKQLTLDRITFQFRTRYSYMTSWGGVLYTLPDLANSYAEPSWILPNWKDVYQWKLDVRNNKAAVTPPPSPAWLVDKGVVPDASLPRYSYLQTEDVWKPYTHEETEQLFQRGLAYFQPQAIIEPVKYSRDLVAVQWPAPKPVPDARVIQLGPSNVYLYSVAGEPLEIEIEAGNAGNPSDYSLSDSDGKVVSEGEIPPDSAMHTLKLQVPRSGFYIFHNSRLLSHAVPSGRANTISLLEQQETRYTTNNHGARNYFYVPRGTKQLQFYWGGGEHRLYDPNGKAYQVPATRDYVTVDVPLGMDGKQWSFDGRYDSRIFSNAPNYIAPSPEALLVPREVAEKDGLKITG